MVRAEVSSHFGTPGERLVLIRNAVDAKPVQRKPAARRAPQRCSKSAASRYSIHAR